MKKFNFDNKNLRNQFDSIEWIENSGLGEEELFSEFNALMKRDGKESRAVLKAKLFALICEKSRLAIDENDIFQDKLFHGGLLDKQRWGIWHEQVVNDFLSKEAGDMREAWSMGAYRAEADFGHTSPNSRLLLQIGFGGLLARVEAAEKKEGLSQRQKDFYLSCKIVLQACTAFTNRLANAIAPYNEENAAALRAVASGAPENSYEAMQVLIVYFFLHEYVFRTRVRTLGRLDVLLFPFYKRDLESGRFTKSEIREMLLFFLNKFSAANVPYGLPFCLGGMDEDGNEVTNEVSYLIVQTYRELDIYSPKIHIRVSDRTPEDFIRLILDSIRGGQSSFVFCNDTVAVRALKAVGISERDARDYTPIGCYEPAVWGKEIGCTGNAGVSLAKAVELTLSGGLDAKSGKPIGMSFAPEALDTFEKFLIAVKKQIAFMTKKCIDYVRAIEKHYGEINPDPLLSCMYEESVRRGVDVYEGGAQYNNSSLYFYFIATLVDSLTAVKKFVYDEKRLSLRALYEILKNDFRGEEKLRLLMQKMPERYGNGNAAADALAVELSDYCASLVNNVPNARGGVFKASLFSIDRCFYCAPLTMATPDGRKRGEALSKNLCASFGMDKKGVLALISSVAKMDHAKFPNGSVLDVVLHPSAVKGEDGMGAFVGLLKTYFSKGGFAMHGNVFNADDLRAAQKDPERYATLQVRVCGWNAYFVNLTKEEQNSFIKQAEGTV